MSGPFADICCARLAGTALAALAEVRAAPGVEVAWVGEQAWVSWPVGDEAVLARLLPIPGVELYGRRDGRWYRHGRRLPAFDFPEGLRYQPLDQVLTPAPFQAVPAPALDLVPVKLELVADDRPRRTTAMECGLAELARWADTVPTARLTSVRAAHFEDRVLLLGSRLPLLSGGERFWGDGILVPLGRRAEPELPESALREALAISNEEILLLRAGQPEVVPRPAFQPLTRPGLRRALSREAEDR
jgi:hypothetical protein